jgi:hypothetical protein
MQFVCMTLNIPDHDPDDVRVNQAADPGLPLLEIAIQTGVLQRDRRLRRQQFQYDACLRWFDGEVPRIDQARNAVEQMIGSARRASDVIARLPTMHAPLPLCTLKAVNP